MTKSPRLGAGRRNCACSTATFCQRFACAVYRSSVADALPGVKLIQLLHNGWRYQEQSAISHAELLANDLSAVGFIGWHILGQFRNTESGHG